ncbi:ABC transporter permease [Thermobacillus xylanilyticus]|nr:ABC transporter permease [Thermobacillus xylanilyticus]
MEADLEALRRKRAEAWRKAVTPYVRDMARSGFPSVAVLAALAALSGYTAFLENVPPGFPIAAVGAALMTLLLVRSPLRTHLRPADAVFLMPREHEMERYMKAARRSGYLSGSALTLAVWLLYAPLYGQSGAPTGAAALVPALLVLKAANDAGAWQERRMARETARRLCRLLRTALTLAAVCALLTKPLIAALGFAAAAAALQAAVCWLPARHRFPWQRLFDEEARTRRRYERFFRSFTDLPSEAEAPARRPYAAWIAGYIRHSRVNTYLMLYTLTLVRTDIGGMLIRLTAVGALAGAVTGASGALAGWAGALVSWLFALAAGVQAGTVRHAHRHAVWRHLYPLPEAGRRRAAVRVAAAAHFAGAVPLGLAAGLSAALDGRYAPALAALAGCLALVPATAFRLRRKMEREAAE